MKVKFKQWDCIAHGVSYMTNNSKAISLVDAEDGEPIAVATVCLSDIKGLPSNEVFIKDYSENEGMVDALIEAGIIEPESVLSVEYAYVTIRSYSLTPKALEELWGETPR